MTEEEIEREEEELRRYGAAQAKTLGITLERDIDRIIHAHRALQRLTAALTNGRHFLQEGFQILFQEA